MFKVSISPTAAGQLTKIGNWVKELGVVIREPEAKKPMVRALGRGIWGNFEIEGSVSSWQPLTEYTQLIRQERGHNPSHPILVQTGNLKGMAAGTLKGYNTVSKSASAGGLTFVSSITTLGFQATISGEKVANQYGGTLEGAMHLPARPFWHISGDTANDMTDALITETMKIWKGRKK
jgi:hypothetical protein